MRKRAKRDSGRVAPSRTAAIGGTRVALIAGLRLARSVTRMPTSSETTIVRVSKQEPLVRQREADGVEELEEALREREAGEQADHRRERSDDESLDHDRARTCRRERAERPDRRELARALRDRDRERVRDHEAADEERDAGEGEQEALEEGDELVRVGRVLLRLLGGELDLALGGRICSDVLDELLLRRHPVRQRPRSRRACPPCRRSAAPSAGRSRQAWRRRSSRPSRSGRARRCGDARPARRPGRRPPGRWRSSPCRPSPRRSPHRSAPATAPSTSVSGLKTESPLAIEKPRLGAPP